MEICCDLFLASWWDEFHVHRITHLCLSFQEAYFSCSYFSSWSGRSLLLIFRSTSFWREARSAWTTFPSMCVTGGRSCSPQRGCPWFYFPDSSSTWSAETSWSPWSKPNLEKVFEKIGDAPCHETYTSFEDLIVFVAIIVSIGAWLHSLLHGGRDGEMSVQPLSVQTQPQLNIQLQHFHTLEKFRQVYGFCISFLCSPRKTLRCEKQLPRLSAEPRIHIQQSWSFMAFPASLFLVKGNRIWLWWCTL